VPTHIALGRSAGLSEEQLAHLADEPLPAGVFDDAERAVVEYARRCTRMEPIDDDLFARLRRHLSLEQVMELCFTVGVANVINRFHATFLTDLDAATLDELSDEPPLPLPPRPDGPGVI
jgi:alkylhydroperoxidase family enzyme